MVDFFQNFLDGLMIGSAYGLLAIGFTLIFGIMRRLNLAYGASIMLGAFLGTWIYISQDINPWLMAIITIFGTVLVGIYVERLCFWAIRQNTTIASMVSSFAIWMQLEEISIILLPARTYPFPEMFVTGSFYIGPYFLRAEYICILFVTILTVLGLILLLYYTRFGLALRAVSENPSATQYMGINSDRIRFWAFILVSFIGGIAGFLLLSADQQITPHFGLWATFKGLIAMTIGGIGSIPGAIIGGIFLGIIETQSQWYLGSAFKDLSTYLALFLFLIIRPGGILGQKFVERQILNFRRV